MYFGAQLSRPVAENFMKIGYGMKLDAAGIVIMLVEDSYTLGTEDSLLRGPVKRQFYAFVHRDINFVLLKGFKVLKLPLYLYLPK